VIKELDIDLIVAFFGIYGKSVNGRTRVQKDICILKHDANIPFNFEFEPHYYGPYSSELTDTLDTLVAAGILQEKIDMLLSGIFRYDYALTEEGKSMFSAIENRLEQRRPEIMATLKEKITDLKGKSIPEVTILAKKCSGIQSTI
jgi:uncharacterized protein YwgA